ncbi:haloacid dehalogenase type II [Methylobacterium phyllosphaerae]
MTKLKVIAFDINETVFSLEAIRPRLTALGLPATALEVWFASALRDAFAIAITDRFAPFRSVLEGALASLLSIHDLSSTPDEIASVLDGMAELKPHPDAGEAFALLADAGFRLIALSNSPSASTEKLLRRGGLSRYVELVLSVDQVQRSKPRSEVYLYAAEAIGVRPEEMALVATHAWDTHGAKAVGLITGFVARRQTYPSVLLQPHVQGETLLDVARALVNLPSSSQT